MAGATLTVLSYSTYSGESTTACFKLRLPSTAVGVSLKPTVVSVRALPGAYLLTSTAGTLPKPAVL